MMYYLKDGSHVLISGATGAGEAFGGKSVLANWWFSKSVSSGLHDMGVFYNPKGLSYVRGEKVRNLREMAEKYREGARLFNFYPHEIAYQHDRLQEFLTELEGSKIVVHDEAQQYTGDALDWFLNQGGNMNEAAPNTGDIRSLVVTQRAWNLPEVNRANMPLKIWVGPYGNEARKFFQVEQMPDAADKIEERTGAYRWSVTDGGEYVTTCKPVPETYAEKPR